MSQARPTLGAYLKNLALHDSFLCSIYLVRFLKKLFIPIMPNKKGWKLVCSKTPTSTPKRNPFTFVGLAHKGNKDIVVF
jgi:hypothetical protein